MRSKIYRITTPSVSLALVLLASNVCQTNAVELDAPAGDRPIIKEHILDIAQVEEVAEIEAAQLVAPAAAAVLEEIAQGPEQSRKRFIARAAEAGRNLIRAGANKLLEVTRKVGKWFASAVNYISSPTHKESQINLHNVSQQLWETAASASNLCDLNEGQYITNTVAVVGAVAFGSTSLLTSLTGHALHKGYQLLGATPEEVELEGKPAAQPAAVVAEAAAPAAQEVVLKKDLTVAGQFGRLTTMSFGKMTDAYDKGQFLSTTLGAAGIAGFGSIAATTYLAEQTYVQGARFTSWGISSLATINKSDAPDAAAIKAAAPVSAVSPAAVAA